jgi:AcrR family transcriptional regulator
MKRDGTVEGADVDSDRVEAGTAPELNEPGWRQRAVSRSLHAARSRAEQRVQRFLDAAFDLIDEKGTTDFTIQEVIDRSKQSLRGFYQYFDGKDELLLALFEDSVLESAADLHAVVEAETDQLARLRAFAIRLHEWCEPADTPRKRGKHNRRPISEFSVQLAVAHPERVKAALEPISRMLLDLIEEAAAAGAISVRDTRRAAGLVQQAVMYSWFGNRLIQDPRKRISAEETWEFCLHGLNA